MDPALVSYIREHRSQRTRAAIDASLHQAGHGPEAVAAAWSALGPDASVAPTSVAAPASSRRAVVRTAGFWVTAIAVVLIGFLSSGTAFVASQDEPPYALAGLLGVAVVAVAASVILLALGKAPTIAWGLLGGVALLAVLALVLFVLGLLVLLVIIGVWIFQAGRQP